MALTNAGEYLAECLSFDNLSICWFNSSLPSRMKSELKPKNSSFVFSLSCSWNIWVSGLAPLRFNAKLTRLEMIASAPGKVQIDSVKCLSKSVSKTFPDPQVIQENEAKWSWNGSQFGMFMHVPHILSQCPYNLKFTGVWVRGHGIGHQSKNVLIKRILKSQVTQVNGDLFNLTRCH